MIQITVSLRRIEVPALPVFRAKVHPCLQVLLQQTLTSIKSMVLQMSLGCWTWQPSRVQVHLTQAPKALELTIMNICLVSSILPILSSDNN